METSSRMNRVYFGREGRKNFFDGHYGIGVAEVYLVRVWLEAYMWEGH